MPDQPKATARPPRPAVAFLRERDQLTVNVLAAVTLIVTVLIRVVFATAKPLFAHGGDLADLVADLGVGYLAAWFFYYLVSWRPGYAARQRLAVMVARQTFEAMAAASQLRGMLRGSSSSKRTDPMDRAELDAICAKLRIFADSTDVALTDFSKHSPVVQSIWRHVEMAIASATPIVETGALFDSDIVTGAAALRSAQITSVRRLIEIMSLPQLTRPGATLAEMNLPDQLWEFMDLAEQLWLDMFERYPDAAAKVGPTIVDDQRSGRARVLLRG